MCVLLLTNSTCLDVSGTPAGDLDDRIRLLQPFVAKAKEAVFTTAKALNVYELLAGYKHLREEEEESIGPSDYFIGKFLG